MKRDKDNCNNKRWVATVSVWQDRLAYNLHTSASQERAEHVFPASPCDFMKREVGEGEGIKSANTNDNLWSDSQKSFCLFTLCFYMKRLEMSE